jgi:hypothetical protein
MKNLKLLGISVTLLCVLSMTAFADDTNSSCAPGSTNSPPCAMSQITPDDPVAPGDTNSPPASNSGTEYSIAEVAVDLLQSVLSLF